MLETTEQGTIRNDRTALKYFLRVEIKGALDEKNQFLSGYQSNPQTIFTIMNLNYLTTKRCKRTNFSDVPKRVLSPDENMDQTSKTSKSMKSGQILTSNMHLKQNS